MTKVTEELFENIKKLLDAGIEHKTIKDVSNTSLPTVQRINRAYDFEEYRRDMRDMHQKYVAKAREQQTEIAQSDTISVAEPLEPLPMPPQEDTTKQLLTNVCASLAELALTMGRLADNFETMTEKMDEVLETKRPWLNKFKS